jgi:hypothetical protein
VAGPDRSGVAIEGDDETRRAFRRAKRRADDIATSSAEAAGAIEADALRRVPVESGALRGTIRVIDLTDAADVVAGSDLVPYAGVVHGGWPARNIPAQPYLDTRRAEDVEAYYADEVRDLVRRFEIDAP